MSINGVVNTFSSSVEKWKEFFRRYYTDEIRLLAVSGSKFRVLVVNYSKLMSYDIKLAELVINCPTDVLAHANEALRASINTRASIKNQKYAPRVSIVNLPVKLCIRDLNVDHTDKLVSIDCTVKKTCRRNKRLTMGVFECVRCQNIIPFPQFGDNYLEPSHCTCSEDKKGLFRLIQSESTFENHQEIRLQDNLENLRVMENPQQLVAHLTNDLVGMVSPGQHVIMNGILKSKQIISRDGKSTHFDDYLDVVSIEYLDSDFENIEITEDDKLKIIELSKGDIRDDIIHSIAPSIYGYNLIKEALALQLFGGVLSYMPDGTRLRGAIHILLLGDPGIAKSQLLRYIVKLAPRGIYVSGKSTTSNGLTASVVHDEIDKQWTIEAGAMALANNGIVAIDEIDKMRDEDRSAMHEAMEQQSISVAKAGLTATLKTNCSVLAAANPKHGRFDPYDSISEQIDMAPSLLTRFDLIFAIKDIPDPIEDTAISAHICNARRAGELYERRANVKNSGVTDEQITDAFRSVQPRIEANLLRKYISYARKYVYPVMDDAARQLSITQYVKTRSICNGTENEPVPITARQHEAIIRLAEASARMRLSDVVTVDDVQRAIDITMESLREAGIDRESGKLDIDIINLGISHSQQERIKKLIGVIRDLSKSSPFEAALLDSVLEKMEQYGVSQDKTLKDLSRLRETGDVYYPESKDNKMYVKLSRVC